MSSKNFSEKEIRQALGKEFEEKGLAETLMGELPHSRNVKIGTNLNVPYRISFVDESPAFLQAKHYQKDIVFYSESEVEASNFLSLYNSSTESLRIPYLIVELKVENVSTHNLITYSKKAEDIKSLFPFSKYVLVVADGTRSKKWDWHGREFDEMMSLGVKEENIEFERKDFENLIERVENQFEEIGRAIQAFRGEI